MVEYNKVRMNTTDGSTRYFYTKQCKTGKCVRITKEEYLKRAQRGGNFPIHINKVIKYAENYHMGEPAYVNGNFTYYKNIATDDNGNKYQVRSIDKPVGADRTVETVYAWYPLRQVPLRPRTGSKQFTQV